MNYKSVPGFVLVFLGVMLRAWAQNYAPMPLVAGTPVPANAVVDSQGNTYSFTASSLIKTTSLGVMSTIATARTYTPGLGSPVADFAFTGVVVDNADNIYAAETNNYLGGNPDPGEIILEVSHLGVTTTTSVFVRWNGLQGSANCTLAVDDLGSVYTIAPDSSVVKVFSNGTTLTVAPQYWFDLPNSAYAAPSLIAADALGNAYVTGAIAGSSYSGSIALFPLGTTPVVTFQPQSTTVPVGSNAGLQVVAAADSSAGVVSYQWYLNGSPIGGAAGTMAASAVGNSVQATYSTVVPGTYTVAVSTNAGSVTSAGAVVTFVTSGGVPVTPAPTIIAQPQGGTFVLGGAGLALSVTGASTLPITYQWLLNGVNVSGATAATYVAVAPGVYTVVVTTGAGSVTSATATVTEMTAGGVPVIAAPTLTAQPQGGAFGYGGSVVLTVTAVSSLPVSYQWLLNGVNVAGATGAGYTATAPGSYTVVATTGAGSVTSAAATVALASRLVNVSSRAAVGTGGNVAVVGFIIGSYTGATKQVLVRAVGPTLASYGLAGVLAQPALLLLNSSGQVVASNTGWNNSASIAAADVTAGAFPLQTGSADSALVASLAPGAYTAEVAGVGGTTGIALAEVYELASDGGHFVNISTRAPVGTGTNALIGGFVISGSQPGPVLIRAVGPGLAAFGVAGVLAQPVLTVYSAAGQPIGTNQGWSSGSSSSFIALAAAANTLNTFALTPGSADSAVLLTLPPGSYTAQVTGAGGSTGVALMEVYQVPGP